MANQPSPLHQSNQAPSSYPFEPQRAPVRRETQSGQFGSKTKSQDKARLSTFELFEKLAEQVADLKSEISTLKKIQLFQNSEIQHFKDLLSEKVKIIQKLGKENLGLREELCKTKARLTKVVAERDRSRNRHSNLLDRLKTQQRIGTPQKNRTEHEDSSGNSQEYESESDNAIQKTGSSFSYTDESSGEQSRDCFQSSDEAFQSSIVSSSESHNTSEDTDQSISPRKQGPRSANRILTGWSLNRLQKNIPAVICSNFIREYDRLTQEERNNIIAYICGLVGITYPIPRTDAESEKLLEETKRRELLSLREKGEGISLKEENRRLNLEKEVHVLRLKEQAKVLSLVAILYYNSEIGLRVYNLHTLSTACTSNCWLLFKQISDIKDPKQFWRFNGLPKPFGVKRSKADLEKLPAFASRFTLWKKGNRSVAELARIFIKRYRLYTTREKDDLLKLVYYRLGIVRTALVNKENRGISTQAKKQCLSIALVLLHDTLSENEIKRRVNLCK